MPSKECKNCFRCAHYIFVENDPSTGCVETCKFHFECRFDGVKPNEDGSCLFFEPTETYLKGE